MEAESTRRTPLLRGRQHHACDDHGQAHPAEDITIDAAALRSITLTAPKAYTAQLAREQRAMGQFRGAAMDQAEPTRLTYADFLAVWKAATASATPDTQRAVGLAVVALAPAMPRPAEIMRLSPRTTVTIETEHGAMTAQVVRYKTLATTGELPRVSPVIPDTGWTAGGAHIPFREAWERLGGLSEGDSVSEFLMKRGARGTLKEGELVI